MGAHNVELAIWSCAVALCHFEPYQTRVDAKRDGLQTWRVISWPLIGILFWWAAGRGIEALLAARRRVVRPQIGWTETIIGAALFLFCAVIAIGVPICAGIDKDFPMKLFVAGSGTWAVLGGMIVAARVAQWRIIRRREGLSNSLEISQA
jgi:hypothetical protein